MLLCSSPWPHPMHLWNVSGIRSLDSAIVVGWPELQQKRLPSSYMPQPTQFVTTLSFRYSGLQPLVGSKSRTTFGTLAAPTRMQKSSQLRGCMRMPAKRTTELRLQPFAPFPAFRNPTTFVKEEHKMDAHGPMIVPSLSDAPTLKYCGWKKSCTSWDR